MAKDRTTAQEIIYLCIEYTILLLILGALVNWLYPIAYERELARQPLGIWLLGYSLSIFALSSLVMIVSLLWFKQLNKRSVLGAICAGLTSFFAILLYSIVVIKSSPTGIGITIIDIMNAKFFAEWHFLKFICIVAPICALLSGCLTWIKSYRFQLFK